MANFEMLDRVVGAIEANPEKHDQHDWARQTECGTTMCFAGWAVVLNGATLKFQDGIQYTTRCVDKTGWERDIMAYASELLDLNYSQANELFLDTESEIDDIKEVISWWKSKS